MTSHQRSDGEPSDLIQSVSRAMRVLEEVGQFPQGVSAKVLAARTGLHLSTTYHLLRTLWHEDYLTRLNNGDYALGLKFTDRFLDLAMSLSARVETSRVLDCLTEVTGLSSYVAAYLDGHIAITEVVQGEYSPAMEDLIPGFDDGAHATAVGKALLSQLDASTRRRYLDEHGMRRFTSRTRTERRELYTELRTARRTGFFTEVGEFKESMSCVAQLFRSGDGIENAYAIGLSGSSEHMEKDGEALHAMLVSASNDVLGAGLRAC